MPRGKASWAGVGPRKAEAFHPDHLKPRDIRRGCFFLVTDHVSGEPFHQWREHTHPGAAQLVDLFIEVVRGVALLHGRGIFIRDFKSDVFACVRCGGRRRMVSCGVMGSAAILERVAYMMVNGWEIVFYALLGLVCGGLAYAFIPG